MSYHGREIIYQHLNCDPRVLCERAFLPESVREGVAFDELHRDERRSRRLVCGGVVSDDDVRVSQFSGCPRF